MKSLIVAVCGLLLIGAVAVGVLLWHNSGLRVFHDHIMGESTTEFAHIEAKLNKIDLDKCDYIGRPEKRDLCDQLVELAGGKRDFIKLKDAEGQFVGTLKGGTLENGKLFRLMVGDTRRYELALKELTEKFGPPHKTGEYKTSRWDARGDPVAEWFVKPHTVVALQGFAFSPDNGSGIHYTYVDNAPWADAPETSTPSPGSKPGVPAPAVGGNGQFSQKALEAIKSGNGYAALPLLKPVVRRVFGQDERLFFANTQTFLPSANGRDGAVLFEFCRAHSCGAYESILFMDTNEGKAAGVLIQEGKLYPYPGDYGVQDNWPQPLKDWWKENTEPNK